MKTQLIMLTNPILVSDEDVREGDYILAKDTNVIFKCNKHEAEKPIKQFRDLYAKIIAGIPELYSITYSDEAAKTLQERCGWVDVEKLYKSPKLKNKYPDSKSAEAFDDGHFYGFEDGFKAAHSLNVDKFSEEDMNGFSKWLDENWRRGRTKKGSGWFHVGDFYKQSKPVKTQDLMSKYIQSLSQPKVFDVEVEMQEITDNVINFKGYPSKQHFKPKITNNSIKVIKVL